MPIGVLRSAQLLLGNAALLREVQHQHVKTPRGKEIGARMVASGSILSLLSVGILADPAVRAALTASARLRENANRRQRYFCDPELERVQTLFSSATTTFTVVGGNMRNTPSLAKRVRNEQIESGVQVVEKMLIRLSQLEGSGVG